MNVNAKTFTVHSRGPEVSLDFFPPIELHPEQSYVLGLISLESYNRIYNIQVDINDKFYYDDYMLTLPPGGYTIDDVHEAISVSMIKQFGVKPFADGTHKFELTANTITHRCRIFSTFNIDFETRVHSIGPLLGFKPRVLAAQQPHESDYPVKFIEDHHISVTCNIIRDVFTNQEQSHSLYDFIVTSPCGYIIRENPSVVLYHPVCVSDISNITLRLVNRNQQLIALDANTPVTYKLVLKTL